MPLQYLAAVGIYFNLPRTAHPRPVKAEAEAVNAGE
jgi:hypothetical protein